MANTIKILTILSIICYLSSIGLLTYLPAAIDHKISNKLFTISEALAFSIKTGFIIIFTISCLIYSYVMYKKYNTLILFKFIILLIIYSFIITILWVTTYYNKNDHYILACFIFISAFILINLNNYHIYKSLTTTKHKNIIIIFSIFTIFTLLGTFISLIIYKYNNNITGIFPSFEISMIILQAISMFFVGFY